MLSSLKKIFSINNLNSIHKKYYKKSQRNCKLKINDILAYKLLYTQIGTTKQNSSSTVNYDTNKKVSTNAYYEQSKKFNVKFYNDILDQLNKEYDKHTCNKKSKNYIIKNRLNNTFNDENLNKIKDDTVVLLVDGTCNGRIKNNKYRTDNALYIYDYFNLTCINTYIKKKRYNDDKKKYIKTKITKFTKTGKIRAKYTESNKNNECNMLIDYIKSHFKQLKNRYKNKKVIFICDKAYHSYDLFKTLDEYGFHYIIRLKDNTLMANDKKSNNDNVKYYRKNNRHIAFECPYDIEYVNKVKNKKETFKCFSKYNITTNLKDKNIFDNDLIKKLYNIRWYIEIFYKFCKKNTKAGLFREKNSNSHKIMRLCIAIINIIIKFLIHIYVNTSDFDKKYKDFYNNDCISKINYSLLVDGLYSKFLILLIKNKYTKTKINNFTSSFFHLYKNSPNRVFPRVSLIPFTKWYVKKYHKNYDLNTILTAIVENKIDELNKNLKTKASEFINEFIKET